MLNIPKIIFPEGDNEFIQQAAKIAEDQRICTAILLDNSEKSDAENSESQLEIAMKKVAAGEVDGVVAGIDYTTREVILAAKEFVGIATDVKTFCSLFEMEFPENLPTEFAGKTIILADGGVVKDPTAEQLSDIILLTGSAARAILNAEPRVACLSFSTFGSGDPRGNDEVIQKIHAAISLAKEKNPDLKIDGEMQLDAAVNLRVAEKKGSQSEVAGRANVLITPDLNSGNILYKSLEQFAGAHAYGPILLGFKKPISDLSRGSTVDDVLGSIKVVAAQIREKGEVIE